MTILILYTHNQSYLSEFYFDLSKELVTKGHDVTNFSLKNVNEKFVKESVGMVYAKRGGYLKNYWEIFKIIKKLRPNIVISNFSYDNPCLLFSTLLRIDTKAVWIHSLSIQSEATFLKILVKKWFLKLADVVIANSYITKSELHELYKVPESKLKCVPFWTGIKEASDAKIYKKKESNILNIGCPGLLGKQKNQQIIFEALGILKKEKKFKFEISIAGKGKEESKLKLLAEKLDLLNEVHFLGHLSAQEMISFYKNMDVVVLPSLNEAFGLVFIEAISLGTPVLVSSKFGSLTFIDEDYPGLSELIFNPRSVNDLKKKLEPYFNNFAPNREYFEKLYRDNFKKDRILENVYTIINK
ncbi:MAG: glycosyltransferase family 4 protein [Gelidibacter sp.]